MNPSLEQAVAAFDAAPVPIQNALSNGVAITFIMKMAARYKLHVDVEGKIAELIRNMLLGFVKPTDFIGQLIRIGVAESTARQLTGDLNTEVFIPLRNEIVKGSKIGPKPSSLPHVPVMDIVQAGPAEQISTAAAPKDKGEPDVQPPYNLISQKTVPTAPSPMPSDVSSLVPPAPTVVPIATSMAAPVPTLRTMQHDMELVQHGSMPATYPAPNLETHSPQPVMPARMFQTASVPFTSAPTQPPPKPEPIHILPDAPVQPSKQTPQVATVKEFSPDPYREPI